jgi:hypothetical protein
LANGSWPFPPIIGIVEAPFHRSDGSIVTTQGYDRQTRLYYYPSPGFEMVSIPDNPSEKQIEAAKNQLLEVFQDFPFKDDASRANMLGLLINPSCHYAVTS